MNLFGFSLNALQTFNEYWEDFISKNVGEAKAEALLPVATSNIIKSGRGSVNFFTSEENWFGMTYPEDREIVRQEIAKKSRRVTILKNCGIDFILPVLLCFSFG